jgi:hypothetical protein
MLLRKRFGKACDDCGTLVKNKVSRKRTHI